jgi:hypothetical protein
MGEYEKTRAKVSCREQLDAARDSRETDSFARRQASGAYCAGKDSENE